MYRYQQFRLLLEKFLRQSSYSEIIREEYSGETSPEIPDEKLSHTYELYPGYNLISIPFRLPEPAFETVLSKNKRKLYYGVIWKWEDSNYVAAESAEPSVGYWVYCFYRDSVAISGYRVDKNTLDLKSNWNLCGVSEECMIESSDKVTSLFSWNPLEQLYDHHAVDEYLQPSLAYWVLATEETTVNLVK